MLHVFIRILTKNLFTLEHIYSKKSEASFQTKRDFKTLQ